MPSDRVFTKEEVKAIIRLATERQEEEAERTEVREHGLSLADLEQLGAEVGLDAKHLRAAADEVRTGRRTAAQAETATATHVIVEHRLDCPFTPEAWEDTVTLLRNRFGVDMGMWYGRSGAGRVERVGRSHEWAHVSQLGIETRVSVSEREGQTRVILSQRVGQASSKVEGLVISAFLGLVGGLIGGIAVAEQLDSLAAFVLAFLAIMLVTTLAAAPFVTRLEKAWRVKKQDALKTLAGDIEHIFEAASPQADPAAEAGNDAVPTARLDLDALPDEPDDARSSERSRTRS